MTKKGWTLSILAMICTGCSTTEDASHLLESDLDDGARKSQLIDDLRDALDDAGVVAIPEPPQASDELFDLGQALSFDKILSGPRDISCLTCHHPSLGSDDDRALPLGVGGVGLGQDRIGGPDIPRNAPELFNRHALDTMFWDNRVVSDGSGGFITPAGPALTQEMVDTFTFGVLSAQAMFPVTSREEMRGEVGTSELGDLADTDFTGIWDALMVRLGAIPSYVQMFEAAYPGTDFDDMTFAHAANAMAAFEAIGFATTDSPFQQFVAGDDRALSRRELQGGIAFFDLGCGECHNGPMLSDEQNHNTALAQLGPGKGDGPTGADDFGRERVTGDPDDRYAFRTTPLFNVELTGPYGHAGQFAELRDHIAHYIDPASSLREYEVSAHVDEEALWPLVLDNAEAILATLSRRTAARIRGSGDEPVRLIERFLTSLTGDSATSRADLVPPSVPSGLPVAD